MEAVLFACLMFVPIMSVVALGLALDCERKIRNTKRMLVNVVAARGGENEKAESLVGYLIDGE